MDSPSPGNAAPGRRDGDLEEELRLHLEMAAEDARRAASAPTTRRLARLKAGGASQAMDALRDQRGLPWLDDLTRDVRHGLRTLRRSPGFTAVALVTLALGIGANTAIFSIVNGVILRPLVYPSPEQLMRLTTQFPMAGSTGAGLSNPEYVEFREMNRSFAHVGAFTTGRGNTGGGAGSWTGEVNLTAGDRPLRVRSAAVDEHLLEALGVQPAHGRFFAPGETDAMAARPGLGGPPIAILSHELWQSAFGGQPLVGATVNVDGRPHEIIGIMPPGVDLMDSRPEIWLPIGVHPVIRQIRNQPCPQRHRAAEGGRHAAGGPDGTERIPGELGRASRREGPCPDEASRARGGPHAPAAAAAGRDCRGRQPRDLGAAGCRRARPADRLRESREPLHGSRRIASS